MAFLRTRTETPDVPTADAVVSAGLTSAQIDGNFKSLDNAKLEKSGGVITGDLTVKTINTSIVSLFPSQETIDCSLGSYFIQNVSSNKNYTFINVPNSVVYGLILEIFHSAGTIIWPSSVKWPNDVAPILSVGKTHIFVFLTDDGGSRWRGSSLVNYTT